MERYSIVACPVSYRWLNICCVVTWNCLLVVVTEEQYKVVGQWSGPNLRSNESSEKPSHLIFSLVRFCGSIIANPQKSSLYLLCTYAVISPTKLQP